MEIHFDNLNHSDGGFIFTCARGKLRYERRIRSLYERQLLLRSITITEVLAIRSTYYYYYSTTTTTAAAIHIDTDSSNIP